MPLRVDGLSKSSSIAAIRAAISADIATLIREGKTPSQAAGQAFAMAREKTGKTIPKRS